MELSVAKYLSTLDAAVFVIDCDWNMNAGTIAQRAVPYVQYLRAHGHPNTPVVLAEGSDWPASEIRNPPPLCARICSKALLGCFAPPLESRGNEATHQRGTKQPISNLSVL